MRALVAQIFCGLLIFMALTAAAEEANKPKYSLNRDAVQSRIYNVSRLVNTSTGARGVIQGSDDARALRDQASEHLLRAKKYFADGDMTSANAELQKSTLTMFQAIRSVGTGKAGEDKLLDDYKTKRKSLDALLDALQRVSLEKGANQQTADGIIRLAEKADILASDGKIGDARIQLDLAYDAVKSEVEKLRSGDTLVRTLEFADKEEEYSYELDRNETHQMLVKLLLLDKELDSKAQSEVSDYVDTAHKLRAKAEQESNAGRYDVGIRYLEESTTQYVRAIRRAGVYIPG
ncbi:MAG: hypothetical protein KZQ92_21750 [Candidatus Thiodiazotropha sp. (ex Lucinoma borealis)]|nr:hypothetical protein [Candidatus Thiodiazotropha sp. (ex Lucinoma borealis)]MCU7855469.1 hypothetical protein [Candidatus Thiodiazotropha sp. (ex Lucinoma borealis)]MCU7866587.1 hypothetical protein [Candidatus Thiodiazotropha sp. (ex Lucinoma borealis)]MCU7868582.1 hypothetical protein [Candidatus Thiodiazotropha sp. (ex Lucinoma borealis)]